MSPISLATGLRKTLPARTTANPFRPLRLLYMQIISSPIYAKKSRSEGSCRFLRTLLAGRLMRVCRMRAEHPGRLSFPPSEAALRRSLARSPRLRIAPTTKTKFSKRELACDTKKKIYLMSLLPKE